MVFKILPKGIVDCPGCRSGVVPTFLQSLKGFVNRIDIFVFTNQRFDFIDDFLFAFLVGFLLVFPVFVMGVFFLFLVLIQGFKLGLE